MQVVHALCRGGSESLSRDLAVSFDPSWLRPSICALDSSGPLAEDLDRIGIPYHVMGRRPGFDWRLVLKLHRLFRKTHVNIVQTHHLVPLVYAGPAARLAGARLVHVEHEHFTFTRPRARHLLKALAPLCHRFVVVGQEIKDFLVNEVGFRPSRITVIPNGVDLRRYSPEVRGPRELFGYSKEDRLIGHVARLEPVKDQTTLLHAFKSVLTTHPNARLVIIGDGSLRSELETLSVDLGIGKRVDFLGLRQDVADLLPHTEFFALSSRNEGLPLSILEAMACARPVVSTAIGAIPAVVRHRITGLTVQPRDPAALAASFITLLEHPDEARRMGLAARRLIQEEYGLDQTTRRYEAVYRSILPRPVGHRQ
jgi:glycosyltransferase involved in cell wall biosynthesis